MYIHLKFQSKYNLLDRVKGRQTGQVLVRGVGGRQSLCWAAAGNNAECG